VHSSERWVKNEKRKKVLESSHLFVTAYVTVQVNNRANIVTAMRTFKVTIKKSGSSQEGNYAQYPFQDKELAIHTQNAGPNKIKISWKRVQWAKKVLF
jgi:hypothetical protein